MELTTIVEIFFGVAPIIFGAWKFIRIARRAPVIMTPGLGDSMADEQEVSVKYRRQGRVVIVAYVPFLDRYVVLARLERGREHYQGTVVLPESSVGALGSVALIAIETGEDELRLHDQFTALPKSNRRVSQAVHVVIKREEVIA